MKDLRDNLSRELESTTQEFLQISKEAYITKREKESNEELTIYADKVKKGTEPQEEFYKLPDSLMAQLPDYIGKNTLPDGMCLINAVSQHLGCNALTMAEILNNIMINNKEVFYIEKITFPKEVIYGPNIKFIATGMSQLDDKKSRRSQPWSSRNNYVKALAAFCAQKKQSKFVSNNLEIHW